MRVVETVEMEATMTKMKELRQQQGLRQIDLAKKTKVSLSWLWALENGLHSGASDEVKGRVAVALGTTPDKIFPTEVKEADEEGLR